MDNQSIYCRVCMTKASCFKSLKDEKYFNITTNLSLMEMFYECTSIDINLDSYSKEICQACCERLIEAFKFRKEAIASNDRLSNQLIVKKELEEDLEMKVETEDLDLFSEGNDSRDSLREEEKGDSDCRRSRRRSETQLYICPGCHELFNRKKELLRHLNTNKKQIDHHYHCLLCSKHFQRKNSLQVHMVQHRTIDNGYKCNQCGRLYSQLGTLNIHQKIHHPVEPSEIPQHVCPRCGKFFTAKSTLASHIRLTHEKILTRECHICKKQFVNNDRLKQHLRVHSDEREYQCEQCSKTFKTKASLDLHNQGVHVTERRHICEVCGMKFKTKSAVNKHKKKHNEQFSFVCHVCGVGFRTQLELQDHTNNHTGERPYKCEYCDKDFSYRRAYTDHIRFHTGRALSCEICKKEFVRSRSLKVHLQTHGIGTRDKICTLNDCGKAFFQNTDLTRHVNEVHLGLRKRK